MGRRYAQDPVFFEAAAVAGVVAVQVAIAATEDAVRDFIATVAPDCEPRDCATCRIECPRNPTGE
jgi:hypothetical protein